MLPLLLSIDASMADKLIILLHGVGRTPADMAPLGARIAATLPGARIAAVPAAHPYDLGPHGFQWFSVDGITEENRPGRIQAALPAFADALYSLQHRYGVRPEDTTLVGFSQGAIMALAACKDASPARHVIAIAGRFAPLPDHWDGGTAVSLVHGTMDGVMPAQHSRLAAARLAALGADVQLELVPRAVHMLGPGIQEAALRVLQRLPGRY
jgi:phospholipase/carboxylesterase